MAPTPFSLSSKDRKRLERILELGHALERLWPAPVEKPPGSSAPSIRAHLHLAQLTHLPPLTQLRAEVAACATEADSPDLQRLAFHARDLTTDMTARHLGAILVPFERLRGRALRDDEFLVLENDLTKEEADRARTSAPMKIIADNIRSAFNVGAIFRTAECFGAEEILLTGYTSTPDDDKTGRTSMGTQEDLPWRSLARAHDAIASVQTEGYAVIALETVEGAADLSGFVWPEKCALLLGNERFGIDHDLLARADHIVRIPVHGRKNSLNVGIAFGIALADWRRKRTDNRLSESERELVPVSMPMLAPAPAPTPAPASTPTPLRPIGVFRSASVHPYEARRQGAIDDSGAIGRVELDRGRQFEQALADLEGFARIWLLYRFHHNNHWQPKVTPPRGPHTKRGVFATRSPHRPNPLGLSCVELVRIEGLNIFVRGFDLLDGTPIYDIKPYLPYADSFPEAGIGWLEGLDEISNSVEFSELAAGALRWLEDRGVTQLRGFLLSQLEFDPLDNKRKRVTISTEPGTPHRIAYRTWRAHFTWNANERRVRIEAITSGYTAEELAPLADDPYADKAIHRAFTVASSASSDSETASHLVP